MHTSFLDSASSSAVFQNCLTLFNTGIRDLAETIESGPLGITNLNIFINVFKKIPDYPQKVEKNTSKMLLSYGSWKLFFSAVLPAQNSPEVHFYFINSPIHSSVLKSVLGISLARGASEILT